MKTIFDDFEKAVKRLEEVLELEKDEIVRDSAVMRFELCFDLAWKAIKAYAKEEGVECFSPRSCFKEAFQLGIIEYDEKWLDMVKDRNLIIHPYAEDVAEEIYGKLKDYLKLFEKLGENLA